MQMLKQRKECLLDDILAIRKRHADARQVAEQWVSELVEQGDDVIL
jgi:hypothetical protein